LEWALAAKQTERSIPRVARIDDRPRDPERSGHKRRHYINMMRPAIVSPSAHTGRAWRELRYPAGVAEYRFTDYFDNAVLKKRPYLREEWCIRVLEHPIRSEPQEHNRYRFWGEIDGLEGRDLRVVTLDDKRTIHNAFPDRRLVQAHEHRESRGVGGRRLGLRQRGQSRRHRHR
jgi:hypothetical protein